MTSDTEKGVVLAFLACSALAVVLISAFLWSIAGVEIELVIVGLRVLENRLAVFSSEDKYCIHFRFIIHMSNTQAVPATADLREREEVDENNQV